MTLKRFLAYIIMYRIFSKVQYLMQRHGTFYKTETKKNTNKNVFKLR